MHPGLNTSRFQPTPLGNWRRSTTMQFGHSSIQFQPKQFQFSKSFTQLGPVTIFNSTGYTRYNINSKGTVQTNSYTDRITIQFGNSYTPERDNDERQSGVGLGSRLGGGDQQQKPQQSEAEWGLGRATGRRGRRFNSISQVRVQDPFHPPAAPPSTGWNVIILALLSPLYVQVHEWQHLIQRSVVVQRCRWLRTIWWSFNNKSCTLV